MASISIPGPIKCNKITLFSPLSFAFTYNSCNIFLPRKLRTKVHAHDSFLSSLSYRSSFHRNLYSKKQRGISLIALDAKKNSESEGKDNQAPDTHELSADEYTSNSLSSFKDFKGKKRVLELFSHLQSIFGDSIQIVVKPTLQNGTNVGVQWTFEWKKIDIPLGKGFNLHISHTYHGKAIIKNIEMLMEPLFSLEPFRLKMKFNCIESMKNIGSFSVSEFGNKAKRILYVVLAVLFLTAFLFLMKWAL